MAELLSLTLLSPGFRIVVSNPGEPDRFFKSFWLARWWRDVLGEDWPRFEVYF